MNFDWRAIVTAAVRLHETPFYLCSWAPVKHALKQINNLHTTLPLRHWFSFKTHPVAPVVRKWRDSGLGVEVVSSFELAAALREGFESDQILINGVAKQSWLKACDIRGLRVHFDSLNEIDQLKVKARDNKWRVGLRLHVTEEYDPDEPAFSGQFGMSAEEFASGLNQLQKAKLTPESVHFHLRSNVRSAYSFERALHETSELCRSLGFHPRNVDFGGGLPAEGEWIPEDGITSSLSMDLEKLRNVYNRVPELIPSAREIWLENGRFITSSSGVLVIRVHDLKTRPEGRYVICDGGRTNHALVSDWQQHEIFTIPDRKGRLTLTTICGPTCMAFDRLSRRLLPDDIAVGDYIVWRNAGAYHVPWETRFSHGLCSILWYDDDGTLSLARSQETADHWWSHWNKTGEDIQDDA